MPARKPHILVAGSSGQVAQCLVQRAYAGKLVAMGRPALDLAAAASVEAAFDAIKPDIVINAAAYTAVDQAEDDEAAACSINGEGAGLLARLAAARGVPLIHLSTDYVFDGAKTAPYVETDPPRPAGAYGRSKLAGEVQVAAAGSHHVILRTAWVYSAYGKNFIKTMLRLAEAREELGVVDDQIGNPTSADDIAGAALSIAEQLQTGQGAAPAGLYHLAGTGDATWAEFAEEIFRVSAEAGGPSARVKRITTAEYPTPARRPANSRLDSGKLARQWGIILPHWQASTRACVEELVKNKGWAT